MCGIALVLEAAERECPCSVSQSAEVTAPISAQSNGPLARGLAPEIQCKLRARGPDYSGQTVVEVQSGWSLSLFSAVLHLRGPRVVAQPLGDAEGNTLCWNGEVFGGLADSDMILKGNDTEWLAKMLAEAAAGHGGGVDPVVDAIRGIRGPFAFVWLHQAMKRVYFGHDRFGRRSLLYHWRGDTSDPLAALSSWYESDRTHDEALRSISIARQDLNRLVLSSVALVDGDASSPGFQEVPATGVFVLDLGASDGDPTLEFHPYKDLFDRSLVSTTVPLVEDFFDCGLPISSSVSELDMATDALLKSLSNSVGVRVRSIPQRPDGGARVGVLFSGGLDSVVLAALTHFHLPLDEPIDLLNVCFDMASGFQSPDRLAAIASYCELRALFSSRDWRLVRINVPFEEVVASQQTVCELMAPCDTHMDFNIGAAFWFLARGAGELAISEDGGDQVPTVSVDDLNGYLRSTRDVQLVQAVAELELFGDHSKAAATECPGSNCRRKFKPGCLFGVCRVCCFKIQKAVTKLVLSDDGGVDPRAAAKSREILVAMGVRSETHVDVLIKMFAQHDGGLDAMCCRVHRQASHADQPSTKTPPPLSASGATSPYESIARVLLVGIGADEQLGGYGRHRTAFREGGATKLRAELSFDMARIWKRNLGRDDRCIAAHGREARFPFLDEDVVATIAALPLDSICDLTLERGEGDKRVLRAVAKRLGLQSCAKLAKRAIQFGSRIAKQSNARAFSSHRQAKGDAQFRLHELSEREP